MTFLSKLGSLALKGLQIVMQLAPIAEMIAPGVAGQIQAVSVDIAQILQLIVTIETAGQASNPPLTGAQKLAAIVPSVVQVILKSAPLAGKAISNEALFNEGAGDVTSGFAKILNAVHPNEATATQVKS